MRVLILLAINLFVVHGAGIAVASVHPDMRVLGCSRVGVWVEPCGAALGLGPGLHSDVAWSLRGDFALRVHLLGFNEGVFSCGLLGFFLA
ncbi:uncharacterized protein BDW70DRAFT_126725 [Aspergillus foveolatus]|uniref:uncharacterized protein n=1 Tax=Aspergillus foveolatus TaxID=210207 RepID=UPI003CCDFE27